MNNWESYIIDRLNKDAEKLAMMKLAKLTTIHHYNKSAPHDQFSQPISKLYDENPEEAERVIDEVYKRLGFKSNAKAYLKRRADLEEWMRGQLEAKGITPTSQYPLYGYLDTGVTPGVFQDVDWGHFEVPADPNRTTFTFGDSFPNLAFSNPKEREIYTLAQIQAMKKKDLLAKINAARSSKAGQNYLEAQMWMTPEEAQQKGKFVK